MKTLSLDLETYSDVNLAKCGVYKYAESPAFEILLFGYAVDGGAVQVIDLAQGETIPEEILDALTDDTVTKWAFNANFERVCLSRYLTDLGRSLDPFQDQHPLSQECGRFLNPAGWKCSMVWSAYMGLPLSLEGVGAVLNLDNQKMKEGRELIRYFCIPCKETKTNGGRTRNLPQHAPEKWNLFKSYNKRDVEVEMAIQQRLQKYPVPEKVWEEYHLDQEINDRGIAIDLELARQAVAMDAQSRKSLMAALKERTGLENPNSVIQMLDWLEQHGLKDGFPGKEECPGTIENGPRAFAQRSLAPAETGQVLGEEIPGHGNDGLSGWQGQGYVPVLWRQQDWTVCGAAHPIAKSSPEPSAGLIRGPGAGAPGKLRSPGHAL